MCVPSIRKDSQLSLLLMHRLALENLTSIQVSPVSLAGPVLCLLVKVRLNKVVPFRTSGYLIKQSEKRTSYISLLKSRTGRPKVVPFHPDMECPGSAAVDRLSTLSMTET